MIRYGHAVKPDRGIAGADLAMDSLAVWSLMDASGSEPKGLHQEVVRLRNVAIREDGNQFIERRQTNSPTVLSAS